MRCLAAHFSSAAAHAMATPCKAYQRALDVFVARLCDARTKEEWEAHKGLGPAHHSQPQQNQEDRSQREEQAAATSLFSLYRHLHVFAAASTAPPTCILSHGANLRKHWQLFSALSASHIFLFLLLLICRKAGFSWHPVGVSCIVCESSNLCGESQIRPDLISMIRADIIPFWDDDWPGRVQLKIGSAGACNPRWWMRSQHGLFHRFLVLLPPHSGSFNGVECLQRVEEKRAPEACSAITSHGLLGVYGSLLR